MIKKNFFKARLMGTKAEDEEELDKETVGRKVS